MNDHDDDFGFEQFPSADKRSNAPTLTDKHLYKRILQRGVYHLSRREYAQQELKSKLIRAFAQTEFTVQMDDDERLNHGTDADEITVDSLIDKALAYLAQNNWQSDQRFAQQVSKVKGERYGSARVKHILNQEGLERELIDSTMAELAQTEFQRACEVWQRKFGQAPSNAAEYAKQTRFMAYRGFSFDIIKKILKGDFEQE